MVIVYIEKPDTQLEHYANQGLSNLPECVTHFTKKIILNPNLQECDETSVNGISTRRLYSGIKDEPAGIQKLCIMATCSSAITFDLINGISESFSSDIFKVRFIGDFYHKLQFVILTESIKAYSKIMYGGYYLKALKYRNKIKKITKRWLKSNKTNPDYEWKRKIIVPYLYFHNCMGKNINLLANENYDSVMKRVKIQTREL